MHTDDHILETFLASNKPLASIACDLSITLVALVHWMDKNVDLLAAAKRALETHITFLALKAEAAALMDLTSVSSTTTNEERKRKSASQLLRHTAKRLLAAVGVPPSHRGVSSPSPRHSGEKSLSTAGAKGMRGATNSPSASLAFLPNLVASGVPPVPTSSPDVSAPTSPSSLDAPMPPASAPSSSSIADGPMPLATPLPLLSDDEADRLMTLLAQHFQVDIKAVLAEPDEPTETAQATTS